MPTKIRIMPTLLYKDLGLVKGVSFDSWRRVGSAMQAIKVYNLRGVDELVFLDISASEENRAPDFQTIDELADECFMPLAVGGGIKTIDDVRRLLQVGADKVVINTAIFDNPDLIASVAQRFGSQCLVASIDVFRHSDNRLEVYTNSGKKPTGADPIVWGKTVESLGAGEILLTSINKDGTMEGYDLDLIRQMSEAVSVPVIASGGAGCFADMFEAIVYGKVSAVAAASIFHFTQQTPLEAKLFLKDKNIRVRL